MRNHVEALNTADNEINAQIGQKITGSSNSRNCRAADWGLTAKKSTMHGTSSRSTSRSTLMLASPGAIAEHFAERHTSNPRSA
jgi:hypothetical protein